MGAKELKQKKAAGVGSGGLLQLKYTPEDSDLSSHQRTQLGLTRGYSLCHHSRGGGCFKVWDSVLSIEGKYALWKINFGHVIHCAIS